MVGSLLIFYAYFLHCCGSVPRSIFELTFVSDILYIVVLSFYGAYVCVNFQLVLLTNSC